MKSRIKLGGKYHTVSWGMNQSIEYCELRGISITKMSKDLSKLSTDSGSILRDLIWSSLKDGSRRDGKEFNMTNYDVGDMLEGIESGEIENFITSMGNTMPSSTVKKKALVKKS